MNATKTETNKTTSFDVNDDAEHKKDFVASMIQGLQLELDKLRGRVQGERHVVNLAKVSEYAGNCTNLQNIVTAFYTTTNTT